MSLHTSLAQSKSNGLISKKGSRSSLTLFTCGSRPISRELNESGEAGWPARRHTQHTRDDVQSITKRRRAAISETPGLRGKSQAKTRQGRFRSSPAPMGASHMPLCGRSCPLNLDAGRDGSDGSVYEWGTFTLVRFTQVDARCCRAPGRPYAGPRSSSLLSMECVYAELAPHSPYAVHHRVPESYSSMLGMAQNSKGAHETQLG